MAEETSNIEEIKRFRDAISSGDVATLKRIGNCHPKVVKTVTALGPWLNLAAYGGQVASIKALLEMELDPNVKENSSNRNALALAAAKGHLDIVKLLHEAGAILDTSEMSANPLIASVHAYVPLESRKTCLDIAQYLIDAGIDTTVKYKTRRPVSEIGALEFACEIGARHIARAIALHQTGGDEIKVQALLKEADRIASKNTEPAQDERDL